MFSGLHLTCLGFLCTGSTQPIFFSSVRGSSGVGSLFQETGFGVLADARALEKQPKKPKWWWKGSPAWRHRRLRKKSHGKSTEYFELTSLFICSFWTFPHHFAVILLVPLVTLIEATDTPDVSSSRSLCSATTPTPPSSPASSSNVEEAEEEDRNSSRAVSSSSFHSRSTFNGSNFPLSNFYSPRHTIYSSSPTYFYLPNPNILIIPSSRDRDPPLPLSWSWNPSARILLPSRLSRLLHDLSPWAWQTRRSESSVNSTFPTMI